MPHGSILDLLRAQRFGFLFATQFLGALTDNVLKNALAMLILFRLSAAPDGNGAVLVTLAGGLFILPYVLFSGLAGEMADRYEKSRIIRGVKIAELALMAGAAAGFLTANVPLLMAVLFGMGAAATFFSPVKYAILPDHLAEHELVAGNGLIEAGTFLAILLGTILGGTLVLLDGGAAYTAVALVVFAAAGLAAAQGVPAAPIAAPDLRVDWNLYRQTRAILAQAAADRPIRLAIMGISWFWLVGATFLSQFPALVKDVIGGDGHVVTALLVAFSVGIGAGSVLCARLLRGALSVRFVPFAALGMAAASFHLYLVCADLAPGAEPLGLAAFLARPQSWVLIADLAALAVCGGLFSVPLYVLLQERSDEAYRSRMVAANNIVNALFMTVGAGITAALLALGVTVPQIVLVVAVANAVVALYVCGLLPQEVVRALFRAVLTVLFRVEVKGLEHYKAAGERVVIVANHQSFLDGCLIGAFLPDAPTFAVNTEITSRWWARPFLAAVNVLTVDPTNPYATKTMIKVVRDGARLAIFPEGRITRTGSQMKSYPGPGMIAEKAEAACLPIRIDGAQFSILSRMHGKLRLRLFPKITLTVMPPRDFRIDPAIRGKRRREIAGTWLGDILSQVYFDTRVIDRGVFDALIDVARTYGYDTPVVEGIERKPVTYRRLLLASFVLGRRLARTTRRGERVGVMLPNSVGAVVTFFALHATGRVPVMLNFSAGLDTLASACQTATIGTVLTSRVFLDKAKLGAVADGLRATATLVHLEDVKRSVGALDKLYGLVAARLPRFFAPRGVCGNDPAVVLFTSGSEAAPKGVVLSNANILANVAQVAAVVDIHPTDLVFNAMPAFHSFGLTGGTLLPILSGIRTFMYPSPLHYKIVPELVYDTNATIMFGTDTFLAGYAKNAHPYDFYSMRYIFAGAMKLDPETRRIYMERFGVRVMEGYGATETAPVLAVNTAMHNRPGTVGRLLPGIEPRLEVVPGIARGGRLHVRGPNVMLGYLKADQPGVLQPPAEGWYDTGDIVEFDEDAFVRIVGRLKRFAKPGGEMVALDSVEGWLGEVWGDDAHAVIAAPDARKGEQVVLVTTRRAPDRKDLLAFARSRGIPELNVPRAIITIDAIPLLGTGKTDYPAVQRLALARLAEEVSA